MFHSEGKQTAINAPNQISAKRHNTERLVLLILMRVEEVYEHTAPSFLITFATSFLARRIDIAGRLKAICKSSEHICKEPDEKEIRV